MREVVVFVPRDIEHRLGVPDNCICYWLYWIPFGDEVIVGYIKKNGTTTEFTSDWTAFLELKNLNLHLKEFNLGSSDTMPKHVLFIDKINKKAYIIPFNRLGLVVRDYKRKCRSP